MKTWKQLFIEAHNILVDEYNANNHSILNCALCSVDEKLSKRLNKKDCCLHCTMLGHCMSFITVRPTSFDDNYFVRNKCRAEFHKKVVKYLKTLPTRGFSAKIHNSTIFNKLCIIDSAVYDKYLNSLTNNK